MELFDKCMKRFPTYESNTFLFPNLLISVALSIFPNTLTDTNVDTKIYNVFRNITFSKCHKLNSNSESIKLTTINNCSYKQKESENTGSNL